MATARTTRTVLIARAARTGTLVAGFLLAAAPVAVAQEALVLSGGGSRGIAHAGAVVGLDRRGYDPDLVVGTSMGAIVGALYASGLRPSSVWNAMEEEDWLELFAPGPVRHGPERAVRYPVLEIALGGDDPSESWGLVPDWRINRRLTRLLFDAQSRARGDFDRLPRRFRAVAADFRDGAIVVMDAGDLARAVRASMSVPGAFAPVTEGGRVLVDGGLADNIPVRVAREMGAKHVIAVDVVRPDTLLVERGPLEMGSRGIRLLISPAERSAGGTPDLLIRPRLDPRMTGATFPRRPAGLLRSGLDATRAAPTVERAAHSARAAAPLPAHVDSLEVSSRDPGAAAAARAIFRPLVGSPFRTGDVLARMDRLYATGLFTGVWPSVREAGGATVLDLRVDPVPAHRILVGARFQDDIGAAGWMALSARSFGSAPSELNVAGSISRRWREATLEARRVSIGAAPLARVAGGGYRRVDAPDFRVERLQGWLGLELRGLGGTAGWTAGASFVTQREAAYAASPDGISMGGTVRLASNPAFAGVVGAAPMLQGDFRRGVADYQTVRARASQAIEWHRLLFAGIADATLIDGDAPPDLFLPAPEEGRFLPAAAWGDDAGRTRLMFGFDTAVPIGLEGHLRTRLRLVSTDPRVARAEDWHAGAEIGLHWSTFAGPISGGVGFNTRGGVRFQLAIGQEL